MDSDYSAELTFARGVARAAAEVALKHYGRGPEQHRKDDGSWVTEADLAAEALLRARIAQQWPDHNVLGEEEGLTGADGGPAREGAPTWVVDPIDGTNNFIAAIPVWATLVALRVDGRSVVGVAHSPALGETYEASLGSGAKMNGEPIAADPVSDLAKATALTGGDNTFAGSALEPFHRALMTRVWRARGFGDFWGHCLVARGAAHVMVEPSVSLWDIAALEVIVSEAGGRLTHVDGSPWTSHGSALSTNGRLHDEVVALGRT